MDKKQFEKNARTLLRYGIGDNIEGAREKLRALIGAQRIMEKHKVKRKKNNEEKQDV